MSVSWLLTAESMASVSFMDARLSLIFVHFLQKRSGLKKFASDPASFKELGYEM
jgi:hypothetical protein